MSKRVNNLLNDYKTQRKSGQFATKNALQRKC